MYLFICTRHREFGISTFCAFCDYLKLCKVHDFGKKDVFLWNISSWCMPQLKRFLIIWQVYYPYVQGKKHSVSLIILHYLRLPYVLYDTFFWKKVIFHEIFQVGACLNLKDSSFYEWFSIHVYKAWSNRYLPIFCSICDSLMLYKVHFVWKRWFFMKYFKLVHAPTWKIPHYMKVILFICTRQEAFCIFKFFSLSWTLLCLVRYIFWEKDDFFSWNIASWCMPQLERWFFMKYFKLVHASTWKIPHFMNGFLFMCTRLEAIGTSQSFALSATPLCCTRYILCEKDDFSWNISSWCMPQLERFLIIWKLFYSYVQGKKHSASLNFFLYRGLSYALYGTFFGKKMIFFHEILQVGACPNLKDSSLYDRFSIHMYKAWSVRFLSLFGAICDSLMPYTVHFHAPTWKNPHFMVHFFHVYQTWSIRYL